MTPTMDAHWTDPADAAHDASHEARAAQAEDRAEDRAARAGTEALHRGASALDFCIRADLWP